MSTMKLRCYCCGDPIGLHFALVSMSNEPVDRVFVLKMEHVNRCDSAYHLEVNVEPPEGQDLPPPVPRSRS